MERTLLITLTVLGLFIHPLAAAEYEIDPERSELAVRLYKGGVASGLAHDHVIHATEFDGTVQWDPDRAADARVEVAARARSLVADDQAMRTRYDLDKELDADARAEIQANMESADQLDVDRFPDMSFTSRTVRQADDGSITVEGDLELHGQTRVISFTTRPRLDEGVLRADAEIDLLQSDFGITPYRAMLGMVRNKDEATLLVRLVARTAAPEQATQDANEAAEEHAPAPQHR